jgi:hypothetical protein
MIGKQGDWLVRLCSVHLREAQLLKAEEQVRKLASSSDAKIDKLVYSTCFTYYMYYTLRYVVHLYSTCYVTNYMLASFVLYHFYSSFV